MLPANNFQASLIRLRVGVEVGCSPRVVGEREEVSPALKIETRAVNFILSE